ncbi:MAG: hypothetical protein PHF70_10605 [Opitutales bacterium]|nr:hypothetical protein [Opitutales bacterium]
MNLLLSVVLVFGLFHNGKRLEVFDGVSESFIRESSIHLFKSGFSFHENGKCDHFSEYLWEFVYGKWRIENGTLIIEWESSPVWVMIPFEKRKGNLFGRERSVVFVESRNLVKYLSSNSESDRFWLEWKYSKP